MNSKGEGKIAIAGLLAVIVIAGYFISRQVSSRRVGPPGVDWACEECGDMFIAPIQFETRECPICQGEAVRTHIYYDTENDELVEVYREKLAPGADPESFSPSMIFKVPGGEWQEPGMSSRFVDQYGFPVPVKSPDNLIFAFPGSSYRE